MKKGGKLKNVSGLSLIEVIVTILVITMIMLAVYNLIIYVLKLSTENKFYVSAREIAAQKIEYINNLKYEDVGLTTGLPHGAVEEYETIERGGIFNVHNFITYYDDPFDGLQSDGTDPIGQDYKITTVEVAWQGRFGPKKISIFSKIVPKTQETAVGGGVLTIVVVDYQGNPVPQASVRIKNSKITPTVDFTTFSDSEGIVTFPGAPASYEAYEITVSKPGFGLDKTYDRNPSNPNPTKPHLTVENGKLTRESFNIDLLANMIIHTVKRNLPANFKVNTDASMESQVNARLAIDSSGFIYVVWQDFRDGSSSRVYAQKFNTAGTPQWLPADINISNSMNMVFPDVEVDNAGNLHICWNDSSVGNQDAYLVKLRTADGSDAWGGARRVDTLADAKDQTFAVMSLSKNGGNTDSVISFTDNRNNDLDIYAKRYDSARNPLYTEIRLNQNTINDGTNQYDSSIASDSTGMNYVAWTDERNGKKDIYGVKINSAGSLIWNPDKKLTANNADADQSQAALAIDSADNLYLAWTDDRNGHQDIYLQKFNSNGDAQWPSDKRVNRGTDTANQYSPDIAIGQCGVIYMTWTDERQGDPDIYAQKLDLDGNLLWTEDQRININSGKSIQANSDLNINSASCIPYTAWQDDRNGNYDIYLSSFDDPGSITPVGNIPLRIFGTSKIGENPVIYEYDKQHWTNASGLLDLDVEWDPAYTINIINALTPYRLKVSDPTIPVRILPAETRHIYLFVDN